MRTVFLCYIAVLLAAAIGWVLNIVALVRYAPAMSDWSAMEVLRVIGVVVAPLGAVLGYI